MQIYRSRWSSGASTFCSPSATCAARNFVKFAAILIQLGSGCLSQIPRDETLVGDVTGSGARALNYSVVSLPRSPSRLTISCSGHIDEWHLVIASSFEQFTPGLMSWLHKHGCSCGISFSCTRFAAIRSIGNAMCHDGFKQLLVQHIPVV